MQTIAIQRFGLFDRFKKKNEPQPQIFESENAGADEALYTPVAGKFKPITAVNDPVFSERMMGDGFAVTPTANQIYSPVNGKVVSVFETKHAIGFETASGLEVLLHMGLDTVELNGAPFEIDVKPGDTVTPGMVIAEMDVKAVKAAKKDPDVLVVVTNMDDVSEVVLTADGLVVAEMPAATVKLK